MSEIWKSQPIEVLQHWIESLEMEASERMTDWELNFVESVSNQLSMFGKLSQKQQEILERLYVKYTS